MARFYNPRMAFQDHFSGHAGGYAAARPRYPNALFAWLASHCARRDLAWDAGCGNGQASVALAPHFARVIGTDPSAAQIDAADRAPNVEYRVEPAEAPTLDDASCDLVTVAQALHWFDLPAFYAQVRRVLRPGGVIAAVTYGLSRVNAGVDAAYRRLYVDVLEGYWPPERQHVEDGYASLPFPFERIAVPAFEMRVRWDLPAYLAYLRTWSATQRYRRETGVDPVMSIEDEMRAAWGDGARDVVFPLSIRAGR